MRAEDVDDVYLLLCSGVALHVVGVGAETGVVARRRE